MSKVRPSKLQFICSECGKPFTKGWMLQDDKRFIGYCCWSEEDEVKEEERAHASN